MHQTALAIQQHGAFVRRLARSLCADAGVAEDLAQDAWLAFVRQPPREPGTVRSWLASVLRNRARNHRREEARREARERAAARDEVAVRDDASERLELQHRVVTAVLQLSPALRRTLLLRYDEGLSAAAIARRLQVPAGTVRAQLSRGLTELRERLDASHPRGRAAWLPALAAMGRSAPTVAALPWLAAAGLTLAGLAAAAILGGPLLLPEALPPPESTTSASAPTPAAAPVATAELDTGAALAPVRVALAPQEPDLARASIGELHETALWIQELLRRRMLVPEPDEVGAELAALSGRKDVGATRLLRRETFEFAHNDPLGVRGGGSYFSFATGSHSYDDEPDLGLEQGNYRAGFYGNTAGLLMDVGDVPLSSLEPTATDELPEAARAVWDLLWTTTDDGNGGLDGRVRDRLRETRLPSSVPALPYHTYVVRVVSPDEHDVLAAFRTVASDDHGHTLVFRVLRRHATWKEPRNRMPVRAGTPPPSLSNQGPAELLNTLAAVRAVAEPRLLALPTELATEHQAFAAVPGQGIARILRHGRFPALCQTRGDGAYLSFTTGSRENGTGSATGLGAHVLLAADGRLRSGFWGGDVGYVADLGPIAFETADTADGADAADAVRLRFLRGLVPVRKESGTFELSLEDLRRSHELQLHTAPAAVAGDTYLVRSIRSSEDVLVAFQLLVLDADGAVLRWRVLSRRT